MAHSDPDMDLPRRPLPAWWRIAWKTARWWVVAAALWVFGWFEWLAFLLRRPPARRLKVVVETGDSAPAPLPGPPKLGPLATVWAIVADLSGYALTRMLQPLLVIFAGVRELDDSGWLSRLRLAVGGLPALAGILFMASPLLASRNLDLLSQYASAAQESYAAKQWERSLLWHCRLVEHEGVGDEETSFRYAECLAAAGEVGHAQAILRLLAPPTRLGYLPAHLALAKEILLQPIRPAGPEVETAKQHLRLVLRREPNHPDAHYGLSQMLVAQDRIDEAGPHLAAAAPAHPELYFRLAEYRFRQGDADGAVVAARRSREYFHDLARKEPNNALAWIGAARSAVVQNNFSDAVAILEEGLAKRPTPALRRLLAEVQYARAAEARRAGAPGPEQWVAWLEASAKADAGFAIALAELVQLSGVVAAATQPPAAEKAGALAREALQRLDNDPDTAISTMTAKATDAFSRRQFAAARQLFAEALRKAPDSPALLNNLAYAMAFDPAADPGEALALVDRALQRDPDLAFHDTRGHVLLRQRRWEEAAAEFRLALPARKFDPALHRGLAAAYRSLGAVELAATHAAEADRLDAANRPPAAPPAPPAPPKGRP